MTTITLTPDIEMPLTERARQQGTTPEPTPPSERPAGETLFDFLEDYVGTVSGTSEALSENCGPRFAEGMADKQRNGTLYL